MPEATRSSRSRPAARGRRSSSASRRLDLRDALVLWAPPLLAGAALLALYFLGHLDFIETAPALAIDAFLLIAIVLYFPMRYAYRLEGRARLLAGVFAVLWLFVIYYPIFRKIYPGPRIATAQAQVDAAPLTLPTAGRGRLLDLVIEGQLERAGPGTTRVARYGLTIVAPGEPERVITGEFRESWLKQRQGRLESVEVLSERRARLITVQNPTNGDIEIRSVVVTGQAAPTLDLSVYANPLPPLWARLGVAVAMLIGAVLFDRATGAGETAASMSVATGTAVTGALAFPSVGSPHPTFRELAGTAIIGGLVGGPIGGLVIWTFRTTARRGRTRARRSER